MTATLHTPTCECVRCCDRDMLRHNPIHTIERDEARTAKWGETHGDCGDGHHHMVPDGAGGGTCAHCPMSVSRDEL